MALNGGSGAGAGDGQHAYKLCSPVMTRLHALDWNGLMSILSRLFHVSSHRPTLSGLVAAY